MQPTRLRERRGVYDKGWLNTLALTRQQQAGPGRALAVRSNSALREALIVARGLASLQIDLCCNDRPKPR